MSSEIYPRNEDLMLRDLYLVIKRRALVILGLPLVLAAVVFVASQVMPKTFVSSVTLSPRFTGLQNPLLSNLTPPIGVAQGFDSLLETEVLAQQLGAEVPTRVYGSVFDEKRGLWVLTAKGSTREEAKANAEKVMTAARRYLTERTVQSVISNAESSLAQSRLDLSIARDSLERLRREISVFSAASASDTTTAAALEARGTDPQVARTSNPALTSLRIDESRLRSVVAQTQARIDTLTDLLKSPDEISRIAGQVLNVQVLVPAAQPVRATAPRPLLYTVVAGALGALLAVFWVFFTEALRPRGADVAAQVTSREKTMT